LSTPPRYTNAHPISKSQKPKSGALSKDGKPISTLNPNVITDPNFIKDFGDKSDFVSPDKGQKPNNIKFDKDVIGDPTHNKFFHKKQGTRLANKTPAIT